MSARHSREGGNPGMSRFVERKRLDAGLRRGDGVLAHLYFLDCSFVLEEKHAPKAMGRGGAK